MLGPCLQIHVSPTEIVHQIKQGNAWFVLDRWTLPGTNLSSGRFGFYLPGGDQMSLASFSHYLDFEHPLKGSSSRNSETTQDQ